MHWTKGLFGSAECYSNPGHASSPSAKGGRLGHSAARSDRSSIFGQIILIVLNPNSSTSDFIFQGAIIAQGAPSDLAENGIDLVTLVENDAEHQDRPRQSVYEPTPSMSVVSSTRSSSICSAFRSSMCNVEYGIELNDEFIDSSSAELMEAHGTGEARRCLIVKYFQAGANWPFLCLLLLMFALTQFLASAADIWLSIW